MYQHARDLEFEQAAHIRDQIDEIRSRFLNLSKIAGSKS
ncbi:MAG: UvrB/UvrC motif-containing protein [Pseudomonadota bacterium]